MYADLEHPDGNSRPAVPRSSEADKVKYAYVNTMTGQVPQVSIASTKVSSDATIGSCTKLPQPTGICIAMFVVPRS